MRSRTTRAFRESYAGLPESIRNQADRSYARFQTDPHHPSLRFKKVHATRPIYSVRVSLEYRAVGVLEGDNIIWFWIGSHSDYDKLLSKL